MDPEPAMRNWTIPIDKQSLGRRIRDQSRRVLDQGAMSEPLLSVPEPRFYKDSADCNNLYMGTDVLFRNHSRKIIAVASP